MDGQFIKFYSDFAPIHIEKYTLSQINGGITLEQLKTLFKSFFRSAGLASGIYSGWADYKDTQYTTGSPLSLATGTKVTLPNNAATIIDSQKPFIIIVGFAFKYIAGAIITPMYFSGYYLFHIFLISYFGVLIF